MKEHSFDRDFRTIGPPAQPHFDDQLTLLSARPVVPLEKIDAKERRRKHWFLGGAFAIAMMLGAASALLASYLKLRNVPTAVSEISEVETPAAPLAVTNTPLAVTDTMASQLPLVENGGQIPTIDDLLEPVTPKKPKRKPEVRNNSDFTRPRVVREGDDEEDELNRIREAVLYDSWQERRARRVARRERRNRVDHHDNDRDLSNLDEIFEGPRRRPPY
jgi:hypothetical protein